jgi:hypothetical protein
MVDVSTTKTKQKRGVGWGWFSFQISSQNSATVALYEDHDTDMKCSSGYLYITNEQKSSKGS